MKPKVTSAAADTSSLTPSCSRKSSLVTSQTPHHWYPEDKRTPSNSRRQSREGATSPENYQISLPVPRSRKSSRSSTSSGLRPPNSSPVPEPIPGLQLNLRLQTKAYERGKESLVTDRSTGHSRLSSVYVDKLKHFYQYGKQETLLSPHLGFLSGFHHQKQRSYLDTDSDRDYNRNTSSAWHAFLGMSSPKRQNDNSKNSNNHNNKINNSNSDNNSKSNNDNKSVVSISKATGHNSLVVPTTVAITLTAPNGRTTTAEHHPDTLRSKKLRKVFRSNTSLSSSSSKSSSHDVKLRHVIKTKGNNLQNTDNQLSLSKESVNYSPLFLSPKIPPPAPILLPTTRQLIPLTYSSSPSSAASSSLADYKSRYNNSSAPCAPPPSPNSETQILRAVQSLGSNPKHSGRQQQQPPQQRVMPDRKWKHHRPALEKDYATKRTAVKLSLPCRGGCCYCVYASLLGPVKVFLTRSVRAKKEPWLQGVRDGYGRPAIPASRKSDITGLVYDPRNHSFHPPVKGQRPMFAGQTAVSVSRRGRGDKDVKNGKEGEAGGIGNGTG